MWEESERLEAGGRSMRSRMWVGGGWAESGRMEVGGRSLRDWKWVRSERDFRWASTLGVKPHVRMYVRSTTAMALS